MIAEILRRIKTSKVGQAIRYAAEPVYREGVDLLDTGKIKTAVLYVESEDGKSTERTTLEVGDSKEQALKYREFIDNAKPGAQMRLTLVDKEGHIVYEVEGKKTKH
jgi:hypothetical protein